MRVFTSRCVPVTRFIFFAGAIFSTSLFAVPVYVGGNGAVSFGVASYGGAPVGAPTYIPNNFTGLADVLTSPGHGFLTADTSIPNNIAFYTGVLPGGAFQVGGGNANGAFGNGIVAISGPAVAYQIRDVNPDGAGAASYEIGSWNATFVNAGDYAGTFGSYLAFAGRLTTPSSAAAVALRTRLTGGPFGAGLDLPQLVLAAAGNGNFQALGGPTGLNAAVLINGITGTFAGLAINNLGPIFIANGAVITATSTLTVIADPAEFSADINIADLIPLTGTILPEFGFAGTAVPEPSTFFVLGGGLAALACLSQLAGLAAGKSFRISGGV